MKIHLVIYLIIFVSINLFSLHTSETMISILSGTVDIVVTEVVMMRVDKRTSENKRSWNCGEDVGRTGLTLEPISLSVICQVSETVANENTWNKIKNDIVPFCKQLNWLNLGGGHHITRNDYEIDKLETFLKQLADETSCQIYIEPGEAVVLDSGILVGEIIDSFKPSNKLSPNIVDASLIIQRTSPLYQTQVRSLSTLVTS